MGWLLFGLFLALLYLYDKYKLSYWSRKGVKSARSVPFFGHWLPVFLAKKFAGTTYKEFYWQFKNERYFGVYEYQRPTLVLRDLKLVQDVLVKDFPHFSDHPNWLFDANSYARHSPFRENGNLWRAIRYKFTPTFSASRMTWALKRILSSVPADLKEGEIEARDLFNRFSADALAAYFATEIRDMDNFQHIMRQQFIVSPMRYLEFQLLEHFPKLAKFIGARFVHAPLNEIYERVLADFANGPSEFFDLVTKIRKDGAMQLKAKDFDVSGDQAEVFKFDLSDELVHGHVSQFVLGGLDTTSNAMAMVAYEVAKWPDVQAKVRAELTANLAKHGGQWTYEMIRDLKYLHSVLNESARIKPVLPFLFRVVTKDYTFDDGLSLKKGDKVVIPSIAFQTDPAYYDDPEEFRPERWENVNETRNNFTWLPFGDGPRQCSGMRFAVLEMKLIFAKILLDYEMTLSKKFEEPLKYHPRTFLTQIDGPLFINLKKRK